MLCVDHLLNFPHEQSQDILNDDRMLSTHHLLNHFSGQIQGGDPLRHGTSPLARCGLRGWRRTTGAASTGLQAAAEINLLEIGTIPPVPCGTFSGVPSLLAFIGAARLLPLPKTRVRSEPSPAYPTRSLSCTALRSHRFLLPEIFRKTMKHLLADGEKKMGWVR